MEKLNELEVLAEAVVNNIRCRSYPIEQFLDAATPEAILAIAQAFRKLEQENSKLRQERAGLAKEANDFEAKLAELERQAPIAWTEGCEITNMQATGLYLRGFPDNSQGRNIGLFTRPAPAADLAQLVPDECPEGITDKMEEAAGISLDEEDCQDLWSVCRAAILRNIEEVK